MLTVEAPAKINIILEVINKREDGFHEIRSLMRTINLHDLLLLEMSEVVELKSSEPLLQKPDNLVLRAANLLKNHCGYPGGVSIKLNKKIPWGAGLGGGSSDAAATLTGLNELWNLRLTTSELILLAAKLGSDVPFFICKGTALVEGRGEKITPLLPTESSQCFVLLVPPLSGLPEKTKLMYSKLNDQHFSQGQYVDRALEFWNNKQEILASLLFNTFDSVVIDVFPGLKVYWNHFELAGASNIHVVGSGPSLFTQTNTEEQARKISTCLVSLGMKAFVVSSI